MNKLITLIGPSGVGKTALALALSKTKHFATALEQHEERPFQALAKQDAQYILANQIDYLLLRAEQERDLRYKSSKIGMMDGGLDLDFHGFTRLFLSRNLLSQNEFDLCRRLYVFTRELLPLPELIVRLQVDNETVTGRLSRRKRINIASAEDIALFNSYLDEWLAGIPSHQVLELNTTNEPVDYPRSVEVIMNMIADW